MHRSHFIRTAQWHCRTIVQSGEPNKEDHRGVGSSRSLYGPLTREGGNLTPEGLTVLSRRTGLSAAVLSDRPDLGNPSSAVG